MTSTTSAPTAAPAHQDELDRLEILRAYKKLFAGDGTTNYSPFAGDRVVRYDTAVDAWDVPQIHEQVRTAIQEAIAELHQGQSSRVVIFAGQAGMGKSHLLNHFRSPARQQELGYVLVGNNNYWKVQEFEECLLTWLVAALVKPSIQGPNLLLEKMEGVAFQALEQILDQPGKLPEYLGGKGVGWVGRLLAKFGRDRHAQFRQACKDRDTRIFRRLAFPRFARFVCDRFLHEKTDSFHRFVLQVLLRYLFPEHREKVCAWLIGQHVHASFLKQIAGSSKPERQAEPPAPPWPTDAQVHAHLLNEVGVADRLDRNYKLIETIKILVSLFSPEMDRHQAPTPPGHAGRVFFFAFDQAEGRKELFESDDDWFKFFAKLSELYNALPNVFIVFTMTTDLRNQLYPGMERQFQQRIYRDKKFVLEEVEDRDVLAIYRRRLELWRDGRLKELEPLLDKPRFHYLPFTQEEVLAKARQKTLREMLDVFDRDFRQYLDGVVVGADARLEFLVALNELREGEKQATAFQYTEEHLRSVELLLKHAGGRIAESQGLSLTAVDPCKTEDGFPALRLEVRKSPADKRWVRVFLARLPFMYRAKVESCLGFLFKKGSDRNFLWLVRARPIEDGYDIKYSNQIFFRMIDASMESRLLALLRLLDKEEHIPEDKTLSAEDQDKFRKEAGHILTEEIKLTYLGELFHHAAGALENQQEGKDHGDE
jgi:hypothetical protein